MQANKAVLLGTLIAAPLLIPVGQSLAQEGMRATLRLGERLESVSESGFTSPQNEGFHAITTIDFGLSSETNTQTFDLSLNTGLELDLGSSTASTDTLYDPSLRLSYGIQNRSSQLTFDSFYRRSDVGLSNFFDDLLEEDVVVDGGTRTTLSARSGLTLGRDGPVTTTLDYSYLRSTYSDLPVGSTRSDSTTNAVNGRVNFRITPVASAFVFANWRENDQDLATAQDQTTQSVGIGGSYDISAVTSLTAQVSYDKTESVSTLRSSSNSGAGFALGVSRDVPTGNYTADLSSNQTINGTEYQVLLGRSLALQRGDLRFSLGAVKRDGLSTSPLANVSLDYALTPVSDITVSLAQRSSVNSEDISTINTRLNVNYNYTLNELSSLTAGLQLAKSNGSSAGGVDQSVLQASLRYNRSVGADWDLVSGIRFEADKSTGSADRDTRTIFIGLEKTFDFRP